MATLARCWTNLHQCFEQEAAELLGMPHGEVMQGALVATAYSKGTSSKRAPRVLGRVVHWDSW